MLKEKELFSSTPTRDKKNNIAWQIFYCLETFPSKPRINDKQTQWQKLSYFYTQHTTTTRCKECLQKCHKIAKNQALIQEDNFIPCLLLKLGFHEI